MRVLACPLIPLLALFIGLAGCGGPTLHSVEGKITIDDKILDSGHLHLHGSGGKSATWSGTISDGKHSVSAPVGKYKVTVDPIDTSEEEANSEMKIPPKYRDVSQTPLTIDVVANPSEGAYDLKLTRK